jgi:Ca2+-binding EF-hand superfamily protein
LALASALATSGLDLPSSTIISAILESEPQDDGAVELTVFSQALRRELQDPRRRTEKLHCADYSTAELGAYWQQLFLIADTNGDGVLQPVEFRALLECNGFRLSPGAVAGLFASADLNHDGVIEYAEFVPALVSLLQALGSPHIATEAAGLEESLRFCRALLPLRTPK